MDLGNNRHTSRPVKAKSLTHDGELRGEFTGECNLKILKTWLVTYQMKDNTDIHHLD